MEFRFAPRAYRDLEAILEYLGKRNPHAATRLVDGLHAECDHLARWPGIGQVRPALGPGVRFYPYGNYLIFYSETNYGIRIARILHGARDFGPADFNEED